MKLILEDGLKCRCGAEKINLDNILLQDDPYGYGAFTLYIYLRCGFCGERYRYAQMKDQTRLTIKQKHINRAIVLHFIPLGDIS